MRKTMDGLLVKFAEYIQDEIRLACKEHLKPQIVHNHPPLARLVPNCPYCEIYGNVVISFRRSVEESSCSTC